MIIPKGPKIIFAILKIATFWPVVSVSGFAAITLVRIQWSRSCSARCG